MRLGNSFNTFLVNIGNRRSINKHSISEVTHPLVAENINSSAQHRE